VNAGGDGVHSPRRAVDDPCIRPPGSAPAFALGGRSEGQSPPVRTLRNTHPSGGRPAAEGCDEGARNGLVPRARGAAARRSPPPVRPPAAFRTAGAATPCPWGRNSRSQRNQQSHRRCRMPHWSRSSRSSLRKSLVRTVAETGRWPTFPSYPEPSAVYCFPPLLVISHASLRVMDFFWMQRTYAVAPAKKAASWRDSDGHR